MKAGYKKKRAKKARSRKGADGGGGMETSPQSEGVARTRGTMAPNGANPLHEHLPPDRAPVTTLAPEKTGAVPGAPPGQAAA